MLGDKRYVYGCKLCGLESDPFALRRDAESIGAEHRDDKHGRMHPKGEYVDTLKSEMPQGKQWLILVGIAAFILLPLFDKLL